MNIWEKISFVLLEILLFSCFSLIKFIKNCQHEHTKLQWKPWIYNLSCNSSQSFAHNWCNGHVIHGDVTMLNKSVSNTKLSHGKSVESNDGATLFYDLLTLFLLLFHSFFLSHSLSLSLALSLSLFLTQQIQFGKKNCMNKSTSKASFICHFVCNQRNVCRSFCGSSIKPLDWWWLRTIFTYPWG